jgi:hypothetical protein
MLIAFSWRHLGTLATKPRNGELFKLSAEIWWAEVESVEKLITSFLLA